VESNQWSGSSFIFTIPLASHAAPPSDAGVHPGRPS
jgi:hypothetical protein